VHALLTYAEILAPAVKELGQNRCQMCEIQVWMMTQRDFGS
jgi:hypothetical protein